MSRNMKIFLLIIMTIFFSPFYIVSQAQVNQAWIARYDGPGNDVDDSGGLAIDVAGNVYVTGASYDNSTDFDYVTIKYDTSGNQLWVARYNGLGNSLDQAAAITLDPSGNIYVTGTSYGKDTSYDFATIKYDPSGNQLWVARYNGTGNDLDGASAIAVDPSGNVYITGTSVGVGTGQDYVTIKYDSAGDQLWATRYNGPANSIEQAKAIASDRAGNVYITGTSVGSDTYGDFATIKYDSSGNQLWEIRYNGPGNRGDVPNALTLDSSGNVYVTGISYGGGTDYDYTTIKYDNTGNELWIAIYNGDPPMGGMRPIK